jgi:hypothetical protein
MTASVKKPKLQIAAETLAAHLAEVLPSGSKIPVGDQNLTVPQAVSGLQKGIKLFTDVSDARITQQDAVKAKAQGLAGFKLLVDSILAFIKVMFPTNTAVQSTCGIPPRQLTPEEHAAKVARLRATRAANGTQGSQQKRKAAQPTVVVMGPDGKPISGAAPAPAPAASPSANAEPASPASTPTTGK